MLVDEPQLEGPPDPMLSMIAQINGNDPTPKKLQTGIYQIGHYGSSHFLREGYIDRWAAFSDRNLKGEELQAALRKHHLSISEYGVCDNIQQILDQCPELQDKHRRFVITVTPVLKANQEPDGGWRWHKWGEYIGTHEIKCEYLYDEEGIDGVLVYHIYEQEVPDEIALDVG